MYATYVLRKTAGFCLWQRWWWLSVEHIFEFTSVNVVFHSKEKIGKKAHVDPMVETLITYFSCQYCDRSKSTGFFIEVISDTGSPETGFSQLWKLFFSGVSYESKILCCFFFPVPSCLKTHVNTVIMVVHLGAGLTKFYTRGKESCGVDMFFGSVRCTQKIVCSKVNHLLLSCTSLRSWFFFCFIDMAINFPCFAY